MSSVERKSLDLSIQVYRQLLRLYPKGFAAQFGDQLVQTFGDLARRAMKSGGYLQLLLLWSRMLPDALSSAFREHTGSINWEPISPLRRRWIMACGLAFLIGGLAANQLAWMGYRHYSGVWLCVGLSLAWMQWVWALRRQRSEAFSWIVASVGGIVLVPQVFLFLVGDISPRLNLTLLGEGMVAVLGGLGVGILQFRILRRESQRAWGWIPANALGLLVGRLLASIFFARHPGSQPLVLVSPDLQLLVASFAAGAVLGYFTSIPLDAIFARKDESADNLPAATE